LTVDAAFGLFFIFNENAGGVNGKGKTSTYTSNCSEIQLRFKTESDRNKTKTMPPQNKSTSFGMDLDCGKLF